MRMLGSGYDGFSLGKSIFKILYFGEGLLPMFICAVISGAES
jgi:hypothetical protein